MSGLIPFALAIVTTAIGYVATSDMADRWFSRSWRRRDALRAPAHLLAEAAIALAWVGTMCGLMLVERAQHWASVPLLAAVSASATITYATQKVSVWRRIGRIKRKATELLAQDVESRVAIQTPKSVLLASYGEPEVHVGADLRPETLSALRDLVRREADGRKFEVMIKMHPLPASATLRAAVAAQGLDPMAKAKKRRA